MSWNRVLECLLNARGLARLRHALMSRLPFPVLRSDVTDVVYVTRMVDARAAGALPPAGEPLCFLVPRVPFRVLSETVLG